MPLLGGVVTAAAALAALGWLIIRGSVRLPLGLFFRASAIALAVLAVVLAGKGIVALQEAGWVAVHEVPFPTWPLVAVYPNLQSLLFQAALIILIAAGFAYSRRTARAS
jgi:high-affinity iron transporter